MSTSAHAVASTQVCRTRRDATRTSTSPVRQYEEAVSSRAQITGNRTEQKRTRYYLEHVRVIEVNAGRGEREEGRGEWGAIGRRCLAFTTCLNVSGARRTLGVKAAE